MNCLSLLFVVVAVGINVATATDYCSPSVCSGNNHIACGNSGAWDAACDGTGPAMIYIDATFKTLLLNAHNKHRNFIAGGGDAKHSAACRMGTMQWDEEMAAIAAFNVKQCEMRHDACRNTDTFKYSGQNLAWKASTGPLNNADVLESAVDGWYSEVKDSEQQYIDSYPSSYRGPAIGHFTVMMADKNIRVGCAAATYKKDGWYESVVACNYATTNMVNFPIYKSCSAPGTDCTSGRNSDYGNLCSTSESYDVNKWF